MKSKLMVRGSRVSWMAAILVPLLALVLACGPGEQPTPTAPPAPTATPTTAPAAVPTPTRPGPAATPTPTTVGVPTPTPGEQPKTGGTLHLPPFSFTPSFDPQLLSVTPDYYLTNGKLYTNLFVNYEGQATECELCSEKGWRLEDGGKTMVFDIRPGIKFHTGQELTAADVAYSLKMVTGEIDGIVSPRAGVFREYVKSITAPSKYELRINLLRPSAFVPKILAVASAAVYREGTTRDDLKKQDAGAGPFIVKSIVPGASWNLVRYPDYFKKGQPYVDGIDLTVISDANTRAAAFLTHKSDIQWYLSSKQFESKLLQLESEGKIKRAVEPGGCGTNFVAFNHQKPPFNDLRMRQAVNLALDRTLYAKVALSDNIMPAVPSLLFFNPGQDFATPAEKIWNVVPGWGTGAKKQEEVEQAKKLVVAAGFPNGVDVDQMQRAPISNAYAPEEIQQELGKIGIRTKISAALADQHAERMTNLDFQIQSYIYCMVTKDPDEVIGQYWITGAARNWMGYSSPEVDKLYIQMSSESDAAKRKDIFFKIQDIIVLKDIGYAPFPTNDGLHWRWSTVHGFTLGMSIHSATGYHRADRLWLEQ